MFVLRCKDIKNLDFGQGFFVAKLCHKCYIAWEMGVDNEWEIFSHQRLVGNDYTVIKKIDSGTFCKAFLLTDKGGNYYVLRVSHSSIGDVDVANQWKQRQIKGYTLLSSRFGNYHGKLNLPQLITHGEGFIIEKYLGENIFGKNISVQEKQKLARQLGEFLSCLHSKSPSQEAKHEPHFIAYEQNLEYLQDALSVEEKEALERKIAKYNSRDTSDEVTALVHHDLRSGNILRNEKNGEFALIDFEFLGEGCIYEDFAPRGALAHYDNAFYDILWNTIDEYNKTAVHKVNIDKVKLFHELGIISKYCEYADPLKREKVKVEIFKKLQQLNESFQAHENSRTSQMTDRNPKPEEKSV